MKMVLEGRVVHRNVYHTVILLNVKKSPALLQSGVGKLWFYGTKGKIEVFIYLHNEKTNFQ